jgi:hypothetical protein
MRVRHIQDLTQEEREVLSEMIDMYDWAISDLQDSTWITSYKSLLSKLNILLQE